MMYIPSLIKRNYATLRYYSVFTLSIGLAALFAYTATKKALDIEAFAAHLELLPFLEKSHTIPLSKILIGWEYLMGVLLVCTPFRNYIHICVLITVAVYSLYIYYILNHAPFLPCSCQGAFKTLSWQAHYLVNAGTIALAFTLIRLNHYIQKTQK